MIPIFKPLLHYFVLTCSQKSPDLTQTSANHVPDSVLATEQCYYSLAHKPFILTVEVNWSLYMYMQHRERIALSNRCNCYFSIANTTVSFLNPLLLHCTVVHIYVPLYFNYISIIFSFENIIFIDCHRKIYINNPLKLQKITFHLH